MVNEPGKVPNLNTIIYRVYIHYRKKPQGQRLKEIWIPFNLGDFPLEIMKLPNGLIYEGCA